MGGLLTALAGLPRPVLAAGGAVVLLGGATGSFLWVRAHQDVPPTTVRLNLRDGQTEVPLDQSLILTASRPIEPAAFAAAFRITPIAQGQLTTSPDHLVHTWSPTPSWQDLTLYTVRLGATRDAAGHPVKPAQWHFTTTLVPRVMALTTTAGVAIAEGSEIPVGSGLRLTFNDTLDPASVTLLANGSPLPLSWAQDRKSAEVDARALRAGPLQLRIGPGARDSAGRPLNPWSLDTAVVFHAAIHTVPLAAPALVQIPNDDYGARDQSGLQAAAVVFESVAEGGITRLTVLYVQAPDEIGPIRSGRLISFKLTRHYHGMLFASGLSAGSAARLAADPVPHLFDTPGWYHRSSARRPPNNLYIEGPILARAEQQFGIGAFQLPTVPAAQVSFAGEAAPEASLPEHRSSYRYDEVTGTYTKLEGGRPMVDAALGQPVRIQLLVVLHTQVTVTGIVEDIGGGRGLDYDLDGSGRAEFYAWGKRATGSWSSADRSSPFIFKLDDGSTLGLPGGLVWVDVVP